MPTPAGTRIDSSLEKVTESSGDQKQAVAAIVKDSQAKDDDTRQRVAMWCVVGYFACLVLILVGIPLYNYIAFTRGQEKLLLDLKDTLLAYQAVVGTLVGAVVAYYFKTQLDKQDK